MDNFDRFIIGAIASTIICCGLVLIGQRNIYESYEKRCIEVNAGTYESGQFKYTDDKVKYILTGKK